MRNEFHKDLTQQIVSMLEKVDAENFEAPFSSLASQGIPLNPTTNNQYQGINILSLWFNQETNRFPSNEWATFKQWKELGANVKKGEKGSRVVFFKKLKIEDETEESKEIPMMRVYSVFNASQVEGYEAKNNEEEKQTDLVERIQKAEEFCKNTKANIVHDYKGAFYSPSRDLINMPLTYNFKHTATRTATEGYYSVLFHELTHWTGAKHRLNRKETFEQNSKFEEYAFEELVAELGAAFLSAQMGITQAPKEDHALYIKSWLQALKNDEKFVFQASAHAFKALDYLNGLQ